MDMSPDEPQDNAGKSKTKRKVPNSQRVKDHRQLTGDMMAIAGRPLPQCPTNADELAAQWQLGRDDLYQIQVKVLRAIKGSRDSELVAEVAGPDYQLGDIAGQFGPGMYFIRGGGRYAAKIAKVPVSEAFARKYGWGRAPEMPTAADLQAQRTLAEAAERPTNPIDLAAAVELAAGRAAAAAVDAALSRYGIVPGAVSGPRPVQAATDRLTEMREMLALVRGLEEDALRTVERRLGIQPKKQAAEDEEEGGTWAMILKQALPIFASIVRPQPQTMAAPMPQAPPPPLPPPAIAMNTTQSPGAAMEPTNLPALTPQEQATISEAVFMLRPFAPQLVQLGEKGMSNEEAATELVGYIPPQFYGAMVALDAIAQTKGPGVLGYIAEPLATERWKGILHALATLLQQEDEA